MGRGAGAARAIPVPVLTVRFGADTIIQVLPSPIDTMAGST